MDINYDHLAWSEVSCDGKWLAGGVIPMQLEKLTSGQAKDSIGRAVRKLSQQCIRSKKPLIMEDLDASQMQKGMLYQSKCRNRRISQFACERVLQTICSQGQRYGYAVAKVNPKYTSFIGKLLYMRKSGRSVHVTASYVIGLRGLGICPQVPDAYLSTIGNPPEYANTEEKLYYFRWRTIFTRLKVLPTHLYYANLPLITKPSQAKTYAKAFLQQNVS